MYCGNRFYTSRQSGVGDVGGFRCGLKAHSGRSGWLGVETKCVVCMVSGECEAWDDTRGSAQH